MIEVIILEQVLLSVLANGVGLSGVMLMKSAPPRIVLHICLASMLAILVPWTSFGAEVGGYLPVDSIIGVNILSVMTLATPSETFHSSFEAVIVALWLVIGAIWVVTTITRSARARRKWCSIASCGRSMAEHGDPVFANELRRTRLHRLPNTSLVFATGLWHPEIWVGDRVRTDAQIQAALNHELCHIASNDQLTLFFIVVVERLLWWNPLIWLLGRQARRQMEYACDSRCQSLFGATNYRRTLAELFLGHQPRNAALEIPLGNGSDIITRMEKIGMTHSLKLKHILTLAVGGTLIVGASTNFAAQDRTERPTLIQCHDLLPEGVQYDFKITSDIDTREGQKGELSVTLVDASKPGSHEVPDGAGEFLRCVQKVVGVGDDEGWPEV